MAMSKFDLYLLSVNLGALYMFPAHRNLILGTCVISIFNRLLDKLHSNNRYLSTIRDMSSIGLLWYNYRQLSTLSTHLYSINGLLGPLFSYYYSFLSQASYLTAFLLGTLLILERPIEIVVDFMIKRFVSPYIRQIESTIISHLQPHKLQIESFLRDIESNRRTVTLKIGDLVLYTNAINVPITLEDLDLVAPLRCPGLNNTLNQQYNSSECGICIEHFENRQLTRTLPCGHAFHASCVTDWLTRSSASCPICRTELRVPAPTI